VKRWLFYTIYFKKPPIPSGKRRPNGGVQIGEIYTPHCRFLHTIVDYCTPYSINILYLRSLLAQPHSAPLGFEEPLQ
jgi:hypothetical protein